MRSLLCWEWCGCLMRRSWEFDSGRGLRKSSLTSVYRLMPLKSTVTAASQLRRYESGCAGCGLTQFPPFRVDPIPMWSVGIASKPGGPGLSLVSGQSSARGFGSLRRTSRIDSRLITDYYRYLVIV
jgi:hypothetical protein